MKKKILVALISLVLLSSCMGIGEQENAEELMRDEKQYISEYVTSSNNMESYNLSITESIDIENNKERCNLINNVLSTFSTGIYSLKCIKEDTSYYLVLNLNEVEIDRMPIDINWDITFGISSFAEGLDLPTYFFIYSDELYSMYTIFSDKIAQVKFITEDIVEKEITPNVYYGICSDRNSFVTYFYKHPLTGDIGKCKFTYSFADNCFYGKFQNQKESETINICYNKFNMMVDYWLKLVASSFKNEYNENYSDITKIIEINGSKYSKIIETGYRNELEYISSLEQFFTEEYSYKIYSSLTYSDNENTDPYLIDIDDSLYTIMIEGGGAYAWDFDIYIDIITETDECIEANVIWLTYNDPTPIPSIDPTPLIIEKTEENSWRISCAPLINNLISKERTE